MKKMAAGAFKVHCLAIMDEVQAKREAVLITKRGKPVAKLVPADNDADKDDLFYPPSGVKLRPSGRRYKPYIVLLIGTLPARQLPGRFAIRNLTGPEA
jgi:prevent-host-death family protein